jgi:hypothetical protein
MARAPCGDIDSGPKVTTLGSLFRRRTMGATAIEHPARSLSLAALTMGDVDDDDDDPPPSSSPGDDDAPSSSSSEDLVGAADVAPSSYASTLLSAATFGLYQPGGGSSSSAARPAAGASPRAAAPARTSTTQLMPATGNPLELLLVGVVIVGVGAVALKGRR